VRIVSLLPSATETLFALGLGDSLVAVTHECDHPPEAAALPIVTRSTLGLREKDSAGIDSEVTAAAASGMSLYEVDTDAILELEPDLVVAQDICDVCAIPASQVDHALAGIPIVRQHPHSLEDVLADIASLAATCGADAGPLLANLRARIGAAASRTSRLPRERAVFLEWLDPPYPAGHWTPDLLRIAGFDDPLARAGRPSTATTWQAVRDSRPETLLLAPCGFDRVRAEREAALVAEDIESCGARRVAVMDGSAYFNRPGPRLVDSLELLVAGREPASP